VRDESGIGALVVVDDVLSELRPDQGDEIAAWLESVPVAVVRGPYHDRDLLEVLDGLGGPCVVMPEGEL
jgi:hypothetical protein